MTVPPRFSPIIYLPKLGIAAAMFAALVPMIIVVSVVVAYLFLPDRLTFNWYWPHYTALIAVLVPVAYGVMLFVRHLHSLGVRAILREWLAAPRSPAEQAAAEFFRSWGGRMRPKRDEAVSRYLAVVRPEAGRVLVIGSHTLTPTDDGTLNEEADALEGRAKKSPRWVLVLITVPFTMQFFVVLATSGINPIHWPVHAWMLVLPVGLNILIALMSFGIVRTPGTVALASPRRVERMTVGRSRTFTTDDSILVITNVNRWIVCAFYRNDGKHATISYPTIDTPGLIALVSRWCMLPPGDQPQPISQPAALGGSAH